jgi:hypothetical protein
MLPKCIVCLYIYRNLVYQKLYSRYQNKVSQTALHYSKSVDILANIVLAFTVYCSMRIRLNSSAWVLGPLSVVQGTANRDLVGT